MASIIIKYVFDKSVRDMVEDKVDEKGRTWIRLNRGRKIGVVVALGKDKIGFSSCVYPDEFNKDEALKRAIDRANGIVETGIIPHKVRKDYDWVVARAQRKNWDSN